MKKYSGFTLIELMITLFIAGILLAVGLPSLTSFMQRNQLVASTNELISAFHIARSEAIKLNSRVTICASSNSSSCSGGTNWDSGWVVFVDADGDGSGTGAVCAATGTDCLLRVHEGFPSNQLSVTGVDNNSTAVSAFTFTSRGLPKSINGASRSGVFSICSLDTGGSTIGSRGVVLSLSGRVRVSDNASVITCP